MSVTTYDPKSYELAVHFLGDDDVPPAENAQRMHSLALSIQQAVEDWIEDEAATDGRRSAAAERQHDWYFYANGTFCRTCGTQLGSGQPCR